MNFKITIVKDSKLEVSSLLFYKYVGRQYPLNIYAKKEKKKTSNNSQQK